MKSTRATVWTLGLAPLVIASIGVFSLVPVSQGGDAAVTPTAPAPAPRPNPFAPLGRAIGNVALGAAQWAGSIAIGTPEELSKTAVGAVKGTAGAVTGAAGGVVRGASRYANDTKADNR